jgi:(S)-citramalyl-CoA lyase
MSLRLRSPLFTPATQPERFAKAAETGADLLIVDLEDAVAPGDKAAARDNIVQVLNQGTIADSPCAIRINTPATRTGLADITALVDNPVAPDFIVLPKCETRATLDQLDALLTESGQATQLIALIETTAGVAALADLAGATSRLTALMFGAADLAAELGCGLTALNLDMARCRLVEQAALSGVLALDAPFFDLDDTEALEQAAADSAAQGFSGRAAVHPAQIETLNAAFTPSTAAVNRARRILEANREGVGVVDGHMVDAASARAARRTLAQAGEASSDAGTHSHG